ncbi:MAG: hypothetical protein K2W97_09070 [Chthoniobacterales bacterium]|nr:hypothetical protein [Chthoniobacterales bacterium]
MKNNIPLLLVIAFMSMIIAPTGKANSATDDEELSSPLMMFNPNKEKEEKKNDETENQQQLMRERLSCGDVSDKTSLIQRSNLAQQGVQEKGQDDFSSTSSPQYATEEPMMIGIKSASSSISLDTIRKVIDADPRAARLIVGGNKNNPSLVAHSPWYGSALRIVFGNSADQQARQILREGVRQKYNPEVANRVCPPVYDGEMLSAPQADHILKMAPVIQEKRNEYPLSNISDENMSLVTYARDTTLVAQDAVTKLLHVKEGLFNTFKGQGMSNDKSKEAVKKHSDFIAVREDAIQATLHAAEAADVAVTALQKITTLDSSFGARSALAAAQFHATIAKLAIVTTGEERHLDYKAAEALWSATDAHDAYKTYRDAPAIIASSSLDVTSMTTAATARKQQLRQALGDMEAVKNYADQVDKNLDNLRGAMLPSAPFQTLPIQQSSMRVQAMMNYADTKIQQLREQLTSEERLPLARTSLALRSEDTFCREAVAQRMLASAQRTIDTLESSIESALEITETNAKSYFTFAPAMQASYLAAMEKAQQEYQAQRGVNEAVNSL